MLAGAADSGNLVPLVIAEGKNGELAAEEPHKLRARAVISSSLASSFPRAMGRLPGSILSVVALTTTP